MSCLTCLPCKKRSAEELAKIRDEKERVEHEKELLQIRDHPVRQRRKSSVSPMIMTIGEKPELEDLCLSTNIEPKKDAENLTAIEKYKLHRRCSRQLTGVGKDNPGNLVFITENSNENSPRSSIGSMRRPSIAMTPNYSTMRRPSQYGTSLGPVEPGKMNSQRQRRASIVSVDCIPGADMFISNNPSAISGVSENQVGTDLVGRNENESRNHSGKSDEKNKSEKGRRNSLVTLEKFNAEQKRRDKLNRSGSGNNLNTVNDQIKVSILEPEEVVQAEVGEIISQTMMVNLFSDEDDENDSDTESKDEHKNDRKSSNRGSVSAQGQQQYQSNQSDSRRVSTSSLILKSLTQKQRQRKIDQILDGKYFT